ncbi:MAG: ATP-binding protein [Pseudomonadota bacterium]
MMAKKPRSIRMIIEADLRNVYLVGLAVHKICSYVLMSEMMAYHLETCVVEAVNNAILHACKKREDHEVAVSVTLHNDRVVFAVKDQGDRMESFEPKKLEFDPQDLSSLPEHGMGLHIITEIMDKVEYTSAGGVNILTMTKLLASDDDLEV